MNSIRFAASNCVMLAPEGMENCSDLHVFKNSEAIMSRWVPTPEELVQINLGVPISLWVFGKTMPPVALVVEELETNQNQES